MPAITTIARDSAPQSHKLMLRSLIGAVSKLAPRQQQQQQQQQQGGQQGQIIVDGIIPTYYKPDGPSSGTVVGIVLGSVVGFVLLVWLFYSLSGNSNSAIAGEEEVVVRRRRSRSPRSRRSHRSARSTRTDMREYQQPPRSPRRSAQIVVEERRAPSRPRSVLVEERIRVPGDDVVEVIEEHDDYVSRRGSRRGSGAYRY
ncbi:hypothetical protein GQ43DRAFT_437488 [Delitschia confertaspora ATCC 74209]|uniref:Uncharacterized protein n=1 Tax=Delitschia confertaspora ATCC 74209 TaxID=1513339 RepID=A0A9P4MZ62_9PLEO|nr:hypothetical protein GQ43DRAFT_437488 [Delitschia confertaspora ATCC 74209]